MACACRRLILHPLLPRILLGLHRSRPARRLAQPSRLVCGAERGREPLAIGPALTRSLCAREARRPATPRRNAPRRSSPEPDGAPRGPVGSPEWVGSAAFGCAGAATAGACGLCLAGSYQTGSGSSRQSAAEESALGACSRVRGHRCVDSDVIFLHDVIAANVCKFKLCVRLKRCVQIAKAKDRRCVACMGERS